jgi:hypothetical protein
MSKQGKGYCLGGRRLTVLPPVGSFATQQLSKGLSCRRIGRHGAKLVPAEVAPRIG